jgi:hypothetical protein
LSTEERKKRKLVERSVNPEALFMDYYPSPVVAMSAAEPEKQEPEQSEEEAKASTSPLANAGPMPAELLKDPYSVELSPLTAAAVVAAPVVTSKKFMNQERMIWISAVLVSWMVTIVAVLRALKII